MSKIALKKIISDFSKEQLVDMILDIYSNRKDAKEYFDFYINPDVDRLYEKYAVTISKEFGRSKHGNYSSARVSRIKKLLGEFASFSPGEGTVLRLWLFVCESALHISSVRYCSDTLRNSFAGLFKSAISYAVKNALLTQLVDGMNDMLLNCTYSRYLRQRLDDVFEESGLEFPNNG